MLKYTLFSSANQLWQKFTEINPCWFRIVIITLEIIIQKRHIGLQENTLFIYTQLNLKNISLSFNDFLP